MKIPIFTENIKLKDIQHNVYSWNKEHVYEFQGRFFGTDSWVVDCDNRLINDFIRSWKNHDNGRRHNYINYNENCEDRSNEKFCLLSQIRAKTYYHWVLECLPRIKILKEVSESNVFEQIDYFVAPPKSRFIEQSLSFFGIPKEKIIYTNNDTHILGQIYAPVISCITDSQHPADRSSIKINTEKWAIEYLRNNKVIKEYKDSTHDKLVYLNRNNESRTIINEVELENKLVDRGFDSVSMGSLSFEDQIKLMQDVRVVVAPHGAALTNIVWCKPGTIVIEILNEKFNNKCFGVLARSCKLNYHSVYQNGTAATDCFNGKINHMDFCIDTGNIIKHIDGVMK